ncbi:DNA replication protein DnaC [Aliivibrio wodanis]|uniref:DNA replication protein DnaC n=1 Tax=Aliivibrio wodanis TaxID=80852 RepID=A0A090IQD6_9GAMM|nr:DNA replication protein DnaC [Aliivibrio wodanis]
MNLLNRLQSKIPSHIIPHTPERMAQIAKECEQAASNRARDNHQASQLQSVLGRSGIKKRHLKCSFENYITENQGQRQAYNQAKNWLVNYRKGATGSFVFSGTPGTGKNHLACAIANRLMARKTSVLVITIADLMLNIRDKYNSNSRTTEEQFIKYLSNLDVLILDEVGIQRMSDHETLMINMIINSRYTNEKPTGILTNLTTENLTQVLGPRVIERLLENNGEWVTFSWPSFRKNKKLQAVS